MSKHFELLQQIGKEHSLFDTPGAAAHTASATDLEPAPRIEISPRKPEPETDEGNIQVRWPELCKEKPKCASRELPQKRAPQSWEWAKTTRREELKLAQRIFPLSGSPAAARSPQVVIFSAVEDDHASSAICARMCEVLAERGDGPVCGVDANCAAPFLHRYFGVKNVNGLCEALCDPRPVNEFAQKTKDANLWIMPPGNIHTDVELNARVASERLRARMNELRTFFKYVVIHSSAFSDRATAPGSFGADGIVLIVEANATRREMVRDAMEELRMRGTPILGVVLNNRTFPIPDAIYHKL
jgi:Mrp family chromosome partitioning ATPase